MSLTGYLFKKNLPPPLPLSPSLSFYATLARTLIIAANFLARRVQFDLQGCLHRMGGAHLLPLFYVLFSFYKKKASCYSWVVVGVADSVLGCAAAAAAGHCATASTHLCQSVEDEERSASSFSHFFFP